jgi:hypothetical protein
VTEKEKNHARYLKRREKAIACAKRWGIANREKRKEIAKAYKARNRDKIRTAGRKYSKRPEVRARIKERQRATSLAKLGLTPKDYADIFSAQGGHCAICDSTPDRLCVDHEHSSGRVRGLLCKLCNLAIGNLRDDPELAIRAAEYLRRKYS